MVRAVFQCLVFTCLLSFPTRQFKEAVKRFLVIPIAGILSTINERNLHEITFASTGVIIMSTEHVYLNQFYTCKVKSLTEY